MKACFHGMLGLHLLKLFKREEENGDEEYLPFKVRFKAWWDGTDPHLVVIDAPDETDAPEGGSDSGGISTANAAPPEEDSSHWSQLRLDVCRHLWGGPDEEEVVQPGGTEYTLTLAKPMALNGEKTVLDMAASLGGGTRRLSKDFDLWITGMEMDSELAEHAMKLSEMHGLSKRAPIEVYDPEDFSLPDKKFHAILNRESLFICNNKKAVLDKIFNALRPAGDLVFTDFVLREADSEDNKAVEAWMKTIPGTSKPWTMGDYKKALMDMSMDLHIFEDKTEDYRQMVLEGWSIFVSSLKKEDLKRDFVTMLLSEGQKWLYLMRALESGELIYLRAHAARGRETI